MISVIICSINSEKTKQISEHYAHLFAAQPFEVILISDALSLAEGYNRGIQQSHGEVLIFSHDDIEILTADFVSRLKKHLESYDIVGVAGTRVVCNGAWVSAQPPHIFGQVAHFNPNGDGYTVEIFGTPARIVGDIQALDGLFIACRRRVVESVRFDEQTFDGFHCYDANFTYAACQAGFRLAVCNDIPILHVSRGTRDEKWHHYMRSFARKYEGKLSPMSERGFHFSQVEVKTKADLEEVMWPAYLD